MLAAKRSTDDRSGHLGQSASRYGALPLTLSETVVSEAGVRAVITKPLTAVLRSVDATVSRVACGGAVNVSEASSPASSEVIMHGDDEKDLVHQCCTYASASAGWDRYSIVRASVTPDDRGLLDTRPGLVRAAEVRAVGPGVNHL